MDLDIELYKWFIFIYFIIYRVGGTGGLLSLSDEPDDLFDWNRLSELQRRNTLCLPHMRSSYPVETQNKPVSVSLLYTKFMK